jgi:hypothetical protein
MRIRQNRKTILIALLILAVATTSAFVGTLAKYVTSSTGSDEAMVAKFELNIPNTINLFSESYTSVKSDEEGKKVIAPGTSGQYSFEVTGTSEVAYRVNANVAVTYSDGWNGYKPLRFSINGTKWTNLEDFNVNLSNALASGVMAPGQEYERTQTIYWEWPFYSTDEYDVKDTLVGKSAATQTAPKVNISVEAIAVQSE